MIHIRLNNENITTTPEHPFYVIGKGWIAASRLTINDKLLQSNGKSATIQSLATEKLTTSQKVYNFEVEDNHNYYVGNTKVLVHNSCGGLDAVIKGSTSSNILSSIAAGIIGISSAVIIGGIISESFGGVVNLPDSTNVKTDQYDELIKKALTKIAILEQQRPGEMIVMRRGKNYATNFMPRENDYANNVMDINKGLSVIPVNSTILVNAIEIWGNNTKGFSFAFYSDLKEAVATVGLECAERKNLLNKIEHIAVRPIEVDYNRPLLKKWGEKRSEFIKDYTSKGKDVPIELLDAWTIATRNAFSVYIEL